MKGSCSLFIVIKAFHGLFGAKERTQNFIITVTLTTSKILFALKRKVFDCLPAPLRLALSTTKANLDAQRDKHKMN